MDATMPAPPMAAPGGAPAPAAPPMPPTGNTAPATMRPDSAGMRQRGYVAVDIGAKHLVEALRLFGVGTPEGQEVLAALKALKSMGKVSGDLTRAEMKLGMERASPTGQPGPENIAAMKQSMGPRLQAMGVGPTGGQ